MIKEKKSNHTNRIVCIHHWKIIKAYILNNTWYLQFNENVFYQNLNLTWTLYIPGKEIFLNTWNQALVLPIIIKCPKSLSWGFPMNIKNKSKWLEAYYILKLYYLYFRNKNNSSDSSNQGQFCPLGHMGQCLRHFWLSQLVGCN